MPFMSLLYACFNSEIELGKLVDELPTRIKIIEIRYSEGERKEQM